MLFIDGNFWLLTFMVGLVSLGISAAFTFLYKQPAESSRDSYSYSRRERLPHNPKSKLLKVGLPVAIATMLVVKFVYWAFMPAFQGSFGGYYWPVWVWLGLLIPLSLHFGLRAAVRIAPEKR